MDFLIPVQKKRCLFHHPDSEVDGTVAAAIEEGLADKNGVVEPSVRTVLGCFELRSRTEIELRLSLFVLACVNETAVTDMDIHTIISTDAVDGFHFRTSVSLILQLIVCTTRKNRTFEFGTFERTSHDGDDHTVAMRGLTYGISTFALYFEV